MVGHFPAEVADIYAEALRKFEMAGLSAECRGMLAGGSPDKPTLGVWLDFKPNLLVPGG
ncbi:MAG TPA: hypothetical protein VIP78_00160 [Candidatus Dormibacteraeota bacterium]|jgi:hypothetical protein